MEHLNPKSSYWLSAVIFLNLIVQICNVAPSTTFLQATFRNTDMSISGQQLNDCPVICHCNIYFNNNIVDCTDLQAENIPLAVHTSANELRLSKNRLSVLTYNNSLVNLETLNVSNNVINALDKKWLVTLKSLHVLDVSHNNLQSEAIKNAFSNLPLEYLNLSYNSLKSIDSSMFYNLTMLKDLDLSNNEIHIIDYTSFNSLAFLKKLDISCNKLMQVKHEWFKNLKMLNILSLNKNNLQILSNIVFWPLNKLEALDISGNKVSSLGLLTFKGLIKLNTLNISNNKIMSLQENIFRSLEQIKLIDLSNNPLHTFDRSFKHLSSLETLYLRYLDNLTALTAYSLDGLSHVKVIDFSGSKELSDIHQHAFTITKDLKMLDLSYLNLTTLKHGVFHELSNLELIKLDNNPWKCDCYFYWILQWLSENKNTYLPPTETVCHMPPQLQNHALLDALDHDMICANASINNFTRNAKFHVGSTALLQCQATGTPLPVITWITPWKMKFRWSGAINHSHSAEFHESIREHSKNDKFMLMQNGDLLIRNIERGDGGFYMCFASNPLGSHSVAVRLKLNYEYLSHIKIVSILVGLATSFGFLLITLLSVVIKMILDRCGVKCHCKSGKSSPKSQQIRKVLESMEHYKKQQLERLRDNYNFQVQRIKDNCMQQMERLRESYSSQAERLRDIRDYGTLQIDRIRENYYLQVQRVRDYSTSQIEKLRENYMFQRSRIRKFSAHHLYKLRENYKLQQQHLNKILENLNIESCRNVCQRTDSIVFEPDITLEGVFVPKICLSQSFPKSNCDSVDNSSQISAYFTPDEAGSELSEQESDQQEYPLNNVDDVNTLTLHECNEVVNADKASNSVSDLQPHVAILSNSELHAQINETIV